MKHKLFFWVLTSMLCMNGFVNAQLNTGTGLKWGELSPSEPLLLNEKFQGFTFFHSDTTPDMGNSDNKINADQTITYGYKNDSIYVPILGTKNGKIKYKYFQCAFAPKWSTAYAFKDKGTNTADVSNGFVEISRNYGTYSGFAPTVQGWFVVDLSEIDFIEVIQWSHSSTGGNKRGVMCEFSTNSGKTWDTLRYQPGTDYTKSFTKDVNTRQKTMNGYRCDPSAYGMTWEEGIYYSGKLMLRFRECGGQTPRIHDIKVYGTYTPATTVKTIASDLKVYLENRTIRVTEPSDIQIFNTSGMLLKTFNNTQCAELQGFSSGIYIIKAKSGLKNASSKIFLN